MWTVHRTCRTCGRKFSWQANGTISRHQCDECRELTYGGDNKLGIQPGKCEGDDIEALEHLTYGDVHGQTPLGRILDRQTPLS